MHPQEPRADRTVSGDFINVITKQWYLHGNDCSLFEIRCLGEHKKPFFKLFSLKNKDEAIEFIQKKNSELFNIYMTINPINPKLATCKSARDEDVSGAFFSFADADDEKGLIGLEALSLKKPPDVVITTGNFPHKRQHHYWQLTTPCTDMEKWRSYQKLIATTCGTDSNVINPSRIMRVAGTVSYPNKRKKEKGYTAELVLMSMRSSDAT